MAAEVRKVTQAHAFARDRVAVRNRVDNPGKDQGAHGAKGTERGEHPVGVRAI